MKLRIDAKQLLPLIQAFYEISGIKIAVYNEEFKEVLSYPETCSALCTLLRENAESLAACNDCTEKLCRKCATTQKTIIYQCHAGLTEMIAPLTSDGITIGYVICGQVTCEKDRKILKNNVWRNCAGYGLTKAEIMEKLESIRHYSPARLEATVKIVNALALYIVYQGMASLEEVSEGVRIIQYIHEHLAENLSTQTLCQQFAMSKARLYHCVRELMPQGIARYIRTQRVLVAKKQMQQHPEKPLWCIAEEVGFFNYEYFLRVFRQETGCSAKAFQKNKTL